MKKYVMAAGLVCLPVAVMGWQGGMASVGLTTPGLQSVIEQATRQTADSPAFVHLGTRVLVAARALSEAQQVALMRELGAAARAIVMTPAFQSAHDAYIAQEYKAVNHGLKVKSTEQALAQIGTKDGNAEFELKMKRDMAALYVDFAMQSKIEDLKMMFDESLKDWTKDANNMKRSDRAKYAKLVARAQTIKDLSASDPDKFRRGYAVLRSAEADGLDTEEAVFGAGVSAEKENAQLMWDKHNLRGALKQALSQIVAEAPTVDFAAQTVQKDSTRVFVNPAYEKKSLAWKAMYRAGKAPTAAGVEIARAWLKEL